jgi:PTS system nitrogen regulatory IIA component
MRLHSLLTDDLVLAELRGRDRESVLNEMVEHLRGLGDIGPEDDLLGKLLAREALGTTAIGGGIAIPHCRLSGLKAPVLLLGLSRGGVSFESVDGGDTHVIFLLVSPLESPNVNLRVLASIAKLSRRSRTLAAKLLRAPTVGEALRVLREEEDGGHA